MDLKENYEKVRKNIEDACARTGRDPASVTLIAVSKTKPVGMMEAFYAMGQRVFGENHVTELVEKQELHPEYTFHMIGHLQRNKVRKLIGRTAMIHSVDSERLAEEISKESVKAGRVTDILLEVNAGNEESKYGFAPEEVLDAAVQIAALPGIRICGLMTVAPFVENPEENRPIFRKMRQLSVDMNAKKIDNISGMVLSMGMTNDYEVAIEEGATHVRVGTGLFGERDYGGNIK